MPRRTTLKPKSAPEKPAPSKPQAPLNGKQRRHLRALGHHLSAVVQVGQNGVTPGVVAATTQALEDHELVKVRIDDDRDGRAESIETLALETGSAVAQVLGRTALLFKQRAKKPKIRLDALAAAKVKDPEGEEAES